MILKSLKAYFFDALEAYYPITETQSFFNLLAEYFLNMKRIDVTLNFDTVVTDNTYSEFQSAVELLKAYRPIQYIIGETEFYGLPFKVDENTLIPRPETEEIVEWILKRHSQQSGQLLKILDIGTGTGCIAISLAKHISDSDVSAIDISEKALKIAGQNAKLNDVLVNFIHDDILNSQVAEPVNTSDNYDVIVSNPPYVRNLEKDAIKPNVLNYEPHSALFVEDDNPLEFYKAICNFAQRNLKETGELYFEINEYLGNEMVLLMTSSGFKNVELKQDMFGKDRMVKGQR